MAFALFKFLKKRKDPRINHDFTDDDREFASIQKKMNADHRRVAQEIRNDIEIMKLQRLKLMQKRQIEDLEEELGLYDEEDETEKEEESEVSQILKVFQMFGNKAQQPPQPTPQTPIYEPPSDPSGEGDLADTEIDELLSRVPDQYIKGGKFLPDKALEKYINGAVPGLTPSTVERIIKKIKK